MRMHCYEIIVNNLKIRYNIVNYLWIYDKNGGIVMITKTTDLGDIHLSLDVVASITGGAATECYGVVGMASQKIMKDGFYDLLGKDNYAKGIVVEDGETGIILNVYIIVGYGVKISYISLESNFSISSAPELNVKDIFVPVSPSGTGKTFSASISGWLLCKTVAPVITISLNCLPSMILMLTLH